MDIVELKKERLFRKYEVIIKRSVIENIVENQIQGYVHEVELPGFRKGSVPADVVLSRYGESIRKDAMNDYASDVLKEIMEKYSITSIASEPRVDIDTENPDSVKYVMEFEIRPDVPSINLETVSLLLEKIVISDQDVQSLLNEIFANENVKWESVNRPVQTGDRVLIRYSTNIGKKIIEKDRENYLKIGDLEKFDKNIIGSNLHDKVSFDYEYKEGKLLSYNVEILEIAAPLKYEEFNDDFAKSKGYKDLDAFKTGIRNLLEKRAENLFQETKELEIKNVLIDCLPDLQVPEYFIALETMLLMQSLNKGEITLDGLEQCANDEERKIFITDFAGRNIKFGMILKRIGDDFNIQVTDREVRKDIEKRKLQDNKQNRQNVESGIFESKVFEKIESIIKIDIKNISFVDYENRNKIKN